MTPDPKRLGVLVPSGDFIVEWDFQRFLPKEVVYYAARSDQKSFDGNTAGLDYIIDGADQAAATLAHVEPELICFCCTSASFIGGKGWDQKLAERLSKAAGGIPTSTTAGALLEAMRTLKIRSMFMVTPYPEDRYRVEIDYFGAHGVTVKDHSHFEEIGPRAPTVTTDRIIEKARKNRDKMKGCDALFFSCTNVRSMQVADEIERELGLPVLTSNQATIWLALGRLGIDASNIRAGQLFKTPYPGRK